MIKVENLSRDFGKVKAVDDISFQVNEHENLILLGTSGCGKTTTLKMINRLIEPTSGKIFIDGKNILDQKPEFLRRRIGYVLQNNGLFPHYTVAENIAIVPQLLKWDRKKTEMRTLELLEKLHLNSQFLPLYPKELSGGQQQRVGLARALITDPPVLLMDEPFGALDNVTRAKIHEEFKALDELKRKTIIMVTHDVQEAFELGDRICVMDNGKIVQDDLPANLLYNPVNNFVSSFLKEQALQLEFKLLTLKDLWQWLPIKAANTGKDIAWETNLWTVLEQAKVASQGIINSRNQLTGELRSFSFSQLMSGFYEYRNLRNHE